MHVAGRPCRVRARSRMPSKSAEVSGDVGLSAAWSSHASHSGVTAKERRPSSLKERNTSLTKVLASGQTPARICSSTKASTSLLKAMVMGAALQEIEVRQTKALSLSFPNFVWGRTWERNSVSHGGVFSGWHARLPARGHPSHPKQSFARKAIPKRSLGTRTNNLLAWYPVSCYKKACISLRPNFWM